MCFVNPGSLGTARVWSEHTQQLRSHSHEVLHHILMALQHFLLALHQILMALHHSQGLSTTSPSFSSHPMELSIIPPCLSSLYFSCPAPPLLQVCSRCPAHLPGTMCANPGPRRVCGNHRPPSCTLIVASVWMVASLDLGLQPPMGVTSSPNPPLLWHSCSLCASLPQPPALQYPADHFISGHITPVFQWVHGLWQWKCVGIV